jgi:hypothetical protein
LSEERPLSIRGKACIAGIYEHPTRKADGRSLAQIHAEVARGALADARDARRRSDADDIDRRQSGEGLREWSGCPAGRSRGRGWDALAPMFTLI